MKIQTLLSLLIILFSLHGCAGKKDAAYVEGLLYLDGKAVRIEMMDGIITGIKHLSSRSELPEVYLAPRLNRYPGERVHGGGFFRPGTEP